MHARRKGHAEMLERRQRGYAMWHGLLPEDQDDVCGGVHAVLELYRPLRLRHGLQEVACTLHTLDSQL